MRVPRATYRLQLGPGLTFDDAAALVDYLDALGVSDAYTSPFLETATRGSHGYDVADHDRLRAELGGEPAFQRLAAALGARGMGLLVDVVPNHMGIAQNRNAWWHDVLENGPASPYASTFDIDWRPVKTELTDKVLLPVLGDQYGAVLRRLTAGSAARRVAPGRGPAAVPAPGGDREGGREKSVGLPGASPAVRGSVGENIRLFTGKPGGRRLEQRDELLAADLLVAP